jgi:hypothetical protein
LNHKNSLAGFYKANLSIEKTIMKWIDNIKNEIKEKAAAREFVENQLKPTFQRFLALAHQDRGEINTAFFEGEAFFNVKSYPQSDELLFDVMIDKSPLAAMRVKFESKGEYISVTRQLSIESKEINLPEKISVKAERGRNLTTFDPPYFSGKLNTDQLHDKLLIRFLTEPVIRAHFGLPQISMKDEL